MPNNCVLTKDRDRNPCPDLEMEEDPDLNPRPDLEKEEG
jgi:hypothetical protein